MVDLDSQLKRTHRTLETITCHFEVFKLYDQQPRFKFKVNDNFAFNHVYVDELYFNKR